MNQKNIKLEEIFPVIEEKLASGAEVTFGPKGTSMLPLLVQGRDSVTIVSPPKKLKKYDLPLYRRANGQFILHRVVRVEADGTYTMCGDNQIIKERGIRDEDILAIVVRVNRKGRNINVKSVGYILYTRLIRPYRNIRTALGRLRRRFLNGR